jgi:hypothetical protein
MGGTQHPLSIPPDTAQFITDYMNLADKNYIVPATGVAPGTRIPVVYPAQVAPFSPFLSTSTLDNSVLVGRNNLESCLRGGPCNGGSEVPRQSGDTFDVYGYSLSAIVAALAKRDLIDDPGTAPADTNFFLIADPLRPNGGILARGFEGMTIPFVGITFYGPAPTNSCCFDTVDVAQQYDFLGGDAPARPLNLPAMFNSFAAYGLLHGSVPTRTIDGSDPLVINQGTYGDTTYYLITDPRLPILIPLQMLFIPDPILAVVDAPLRVLIEDAYIRTQSPGEHVQFQLLPIGNPINLVVNLAGSIPVGIDDGLQEAGVGRLLGTADVYRPFGVGGPVYEKDTGEPATDGGVLPLSGAPSTHQAEGSQLLQAGGSELADTNLPTSGLAKSELSDTELPKSELAKSERPKGELAKSERPSEADAAKLGNENAQQTDIPEGTKSTAPHLLSDPLKFDPQQRSSAVRQNGDAPLKRIVNALTGQRPKPAETAAGDEPDSEKPAA